MNKLTAKRAMAIVRGTVSETKPHPSIFNDAVETGRSVKVRNYSADEYTNLRTRLQDAGFIVRMVVTPALKCKFLGERGNNIRLHIDTKG
jgi:hypothetical protein